MKKMGKLFLLLSLFCWGQAEASESNASLQIRHQEPTFIERGSSFTLTFTVPGIDPGDVEDAFVFYRLNGDMAFKQKQVALYSSDFTVSMKVDEKHAGTLEYYFEARLNNGEKIAYPQNAASQEPIRVNVVDQRKSDRQRKVEQTGIDYTILSPAPEAIVTEKDPIIALTLFYDPTEIDTAHTSFQLLVDGRDVTKQANADDYLYTYSANGMAPGGHTATFKIIKPDTALVITSWNFSVLDPTASSNPSSENANSGSWMPQGQVEIAARNQQVGNYANDALSGNVRLSGRKGNISYSAYGLLTSQEDFRLQPQNRFGASLNIGNWLELEAGHIYPVLSSLTIAGQRIQGINVGLHLWNQAMNLQFIYGKLRREINNIYQPVEPKYHRFNGVTADTSYVLNVRDNGTYKRDIMGARLGFGRGDSFEFGLNFMKVEDDTNSINVVNDFNSLMRFNPLLTENLSEHELQDLSQNPRQFNVNGNPNPKGNFVASSDIEFNLDNNRIQFQADGAVSLLNEDISEGILTQEAAENLGITLPAETENILSRLSWMVILNENMNSLFFRFDENNNAELTFPTGIIASQSELGLNYFNNNLRIRYQWAGPNFNSLANTAVRKDVAGFSITDRFRLFKGRIYLIGGYEQLQDNVINHKEATTNTITYRGNVSWYPINPDLPRVSIGLMNRARDNGIRLFNPYLGRISSKLAVQNFISQEGAIVPAPQARLSETYQFTSSVTQQFSLFGISHDVNLNYSILETIDQQFSYGNAQSSSLSIMLVNQFQSLPMQTNFGFNINNTETAGGLTDISIIGFNVGGSMFFMDNKLSVDGNFAITSNRSESIPLKINGNDMAESSDDYYQPNEQEKTVSENHSFIFSAAGQYRFNNHHSFAVNLRYSNIWSSLSPAMVPNDHLLQARYIFNF